MRLKKSVKRFLFFLFFLIIGGLIAMYLLFYEGDKKTTKKVKILKEIPEYGYKLSDNKSKEYKDLFYKLQDILKEKEVDEEKYVKTISKMFIIDFWSLDNKIAKTDVGGSDFIHSDELKDFLEKAEDTIYKYVESNLYGNREQDLPSVKSVEIESVEKAPFVYKDDADENAYIVKVKWEYTDEIVAKDYQNEATLTFVHEDKKLSLVEFE